MQLYTPFKTFLYSSLIVILGWDKVRDFFLLGETQINL